MDKHAKILVVDSDPEVITATLRVLASAGYDTFGADSGQECLRLAQARKPDLVLVGAGLSDSSGIDLCKEIKRVADLAGIYVVLVSGQEVSAAMQARGLEAGADAFLARPIPNRELAARLEALLRRRRAAQELETALRESQETLDAIAVAVYVVDLDHKIVRCNLALAKLLGKSLSEIVGKLCCQVIHGTPEPIAACLLARGLESRRRETLVVPLNERWLEVTVDPLLNDAGSVVGGVHVMSDITERKLAEEALLQERHLLSVVVSESNAVVMVLDAQGRIMRCNRACEQITGYNVNEVKGKSVWDVFVPPEETEQARGVFQTLLAGHFASDYENTWVARDGSRHRIAWSNMAVLDAQGKLEYVVASGIDVTERRQTEAALRGERDLAQAIVDRAGVLLMVLDGQGRIVRLNRAAEQALGALLPDVQGKLVWECGLGPQEAFAGLASGQVVNAVECPLTLADGQQRWFGWSNTTLLDSAGALQYVICSGVDVTQRKAAETALRGERDLAQDVVQSAGALLLLLDGQGRIVRWNQACQQATGFAADEALGRNAWELLLAPEEARAVAERLVAQGLPGGLQREDEWRSKDGASRRIEWSASVLHDGQYVLVSGSDVTHRHAAAEALRHERDLAQEIIDQAGALTLVLDEQGRIVRFNQACAQATGFSAAEVQGKALWDVLLAPEEAEAVRAALSSATTDSFGKEYENHWLNQQGGRRLIRWSQAGIAGPGGAPAHVVISADDITERRQAEEEALRQNQQRLQMAAQAAGDWIYEWDVATGALELPDGLEQALGYAPGELPRRIEAWQAGVHPADRERVRAATQRLLQAREPFAQEYRVQGRDGRLRYWQERASAVWDEQGRARRWMGAITDVTAQKEAGLAWLRLQTELATAQQREALRQQAVQVAGDFEDLATLIMGNAEVSLASVDPAHPVQRKLAIIHKSAQRAAALTGELLARGQPPALQMAGTDLNALLSDMAVMLRQTLDPSIDVQLGLAPEAGVVQADAGALRQVLAFWTLRAREAMPPERGGGTLRLESARETLDEAQLQALGASARTCQAGEQARLSVVAQPAAKSVVPTGALASNGGATDAGRSLVQWIVQRHSGCLREAQEGGGWRMDVYLPAGGK